MTIQEAIKERHMVRKYLEKPIPTETYSDGNRSSITGAVDGG